jgi:hypothetical protein
MAGDRVSWPKAQAARRVLAWIRLGGIMATMMGAASISGLVAPSDSSREGHRAGRERGPTTRKKHQIGAFSDDKTDSCKKSTKSVLLNKQYA